MCAVYNSERFKKNNIDHKLRYDYFMHSDSLFQFRENEYSIFCTILYIYETSNYTFNYILHAIDHAKSQIHIICHR